MPGKAKKLIIAVLVVAVIGLLYYYAEIYRRKEGPEPVRTTGVVEALETNISAKVAGKLAAVNFREGDRVRAGDLVAELEDRDLEAAHRQAVAALGAAEAEFMNARNAVESARAQVDVAGAEVESSGASVSKAEARLVQAEKDLARAEELFGKGVVSMADLDRARTDRDTGAAELAGAKAGLSLSRSKKAAAFSALKEAEGNIPALRARVSEAKGLVDLQQARLADTRIHSPVEAVVEYRTLEPGEVVSPGTVILTLIDLDNLWVRIDLEQRRVTGVKAGQRADITIEGVPGKLFVGEVFDIGREGEFATERDVTRGRQDIKTFRTRIRVKDPEGILKPGMTVIVEIPVQG